MQKLKQPDIKGMQIHNQREKESQTNPDIDQTKIHMNYDLVNPESIDYNKKINEMIEEGVTTGKAIRKDAVKLASFLVTSDSTFFDTIDESEEKRFFETAYEYLCKEYGKDNIAYATVHKDEKTPHMHVGFVPITEDGRLSAKDFFGKKQQLVRLQDNFHKHMMEAGFDLERGVSSDRKHLDSARFKAETLKKEIEGLEKTLQGIKEIHESSKEIKDIPDPKKVLGQVMMKMEDHAILKQHAEEGAIAKVENFKLEAELEVIRQENAHLKSELQTSQDRLRKHYRDIEDESKELKENFSQIVETKVKEETAEAKLNWVEQYNDLVRKHNGMIENNKENRELKDKEIQGLKTERDTLKNENEFYKNENSVLKEAFDKVKNEFTHYKQVAERALDGIINRVKTFLMRKDVDPKIINEMLQEKESLKSRAFNYAEKELKNERQPQRQQENYLEM